MKTLHQVISTYKTKTITRRTTTKTHVSIKYVIERMIVTDNLSFLQINLSLYIHISGIIDQRVFMDF